MKQIDNSQLADATAERVRQSHAAAIREMQLSPLAGCRVLQDRELADGVATPIAHGLGRAPVFVSVSPPRGASSTGRIDEIRDGQLDRAKYIVLKATGYGATVKVDVLMIGG